MTFNSITGDPVYDVGVAGLLIWLIKQGVITVRARGAGDDGQDILKSITETLAGIGVTLKTLSDHAVQNTDLLRRNDERHSNRGNMCAWSAENAPRDVEQLKDLPRRIDKMDQTLHNTREIIIAANGKLADIKEQVGSLAVHCKGPKT